ncbi:MAG: hypothetical protein EZS28_001234 [Streblomastix strix]|uniref:Uncharacterized protein n=1 Tax=Streblomastix strix TaxID=222440 RepID=A0A5J4X7N2_9EUKA|nr:MAG: hypothetical protein EZS28_001234 [Streblomastix strix]
MAESRSIRTMFEVRNQPTLFDKVAEAAFLFPGQIKRISNDLGVTIQVLYTMIYCYLMDIPYKGGNGRRHEYYLPKVIVNKIAAEIRQMEAQHASHSRIEVSGMLHEAKSVLYEYCKGVAISLQFLPMIKRFSQEVKHPSEAYVALFCKIIVMRLTHIKFGKESQIDDNKQMAGIASNKSAWFRLIFTERISCKFRDRAILNGDEVAVNLDSDVVLAKSRSNK